MMPVIPAAEFTQQPDESVNDVIFLRVDITYTT